MQSKTKPIVSSSNSLRLQKLGSWVMQNREQTLTILGILGIGLVLLVFVIHRHMSETDEAWTKLSNAQGYLTQNQTQTAAQALDQWTGQYAHTGARTYAQFLRADLLYSTSDYARAAELYKQLANAARPTVLMQPLALSGESAAEEMAGNYAQALSTTQRFLDHYPDHFLAGPMMISQARLNELAGNTAAAATVYERFIILYPQSPWTSLARARQQALTSASHPIPAGVPTPPLKNTP